MLCNVVVSVEPAGHEHRMGVKWGHRVLCNAVMAVELAGREHCVPVKWGHRVLCNAVVAVELAGREHCVRVKWGCDRFGICTCKLKFYLKTNIMSSIGEQKLQVTFYFQQENKYNLLR